MAEGARAVIEVTAGIIPGQPEEEFTKRWVISTSEWAEVQEKDGGAAGELLATFAGRAQGWATLLMLQPERLNWVRTDWIWL